MAWRRGRKGDFIMMQQPTADGEGIAWWGNVYEGVGAPILWLQTVWAHLLTSIMEKMGVRETGYGTWCMAKSCNIWAIQPNQCNTTINQQTTIHISVVFGVRVIIFMLRLSKWCHEAWIFGGENLLHRVENVGLQKTVQSRFAAHGRFPEEVADMPISSYLGLGYTIHLFIAKIRHRVTEALPKSDNT